MVSPTRKIKLMYTLAGWIMILRHPIKNPRDYARAIDMLQGDIDRIKL